MNSLNPVFDVYWDMLVSGADPGLRRTAMHAYMFAHFWPGLYRVGHRRWRL